MMAEKPANWYQSKAHLRKSEKSLSLNGTSQNETFKPTPAKSQKSSMSRSESKGNIFFIFLEDKPGWLIEVRTLIKPPEDLWHSDQMANTDHGHGQHPISIKWLLEIKSNMTKVCLCNIFLQQFLSFWTKNSQISKIVMVMMKRYKSAKLARRAQQAEDEAISCFCGSTRKISRRSAHFHFHFFFNFHFYSAWEDAWVMSDVGL